MKEVTARHLTEGSRVTWDNNPADCGTVIETSYNRCKVRWDDPANGEISVLYFTEMANIGLAKPAGKPRSGEHVTNLSASEVGI